MPTAPKVALEGQTLVFEGDWVLANPVREIPALEQVKEVDVSKVSAWDSTLVAVLWKIQRSAGVGGGEKIKIKALPENLKKMLALSSESVEGVPQKRAVTSQRYKAAVWLKNVWAAVGDAISFLGEIFIRLGRMLKHREHFRANDWLLEFHEAGAKALPIVGFLSFLVGLILAFVSAIQLQLFGASIYVADLVGVSMTREMGALITGIIMAGRTGASYAAQIGSMKRSEELDALRTMGLSPIDMVVLPKVVALTCMLPMLTIFSMFVGMFAGLLVGNSVLGLSVFQYINETAMAVPLKSLFIGLIKSFVYGFLVAFAGAWRGMRCGLSADAVGKAATSAVVLSLTLIVIANAIFAIMLNALKI